ncbi:MAG TPA: leucyl aminopeptidase family protein [Steroidobacteraceae bacterium]|nr:leucyl aminopeptidase family protein [Steroidobacteraceae bacterium]
MPFSSLLVPVRQTAARPGTAMLARYECAIVFLPAEPSPADWAAVPHGGLLRALYGLKERKPGDTIQLRVGERAETLVLAVCLAGTASMFERLNAAGKLARLALEGEPQSLLLHAYGGDGEVLHDALNATVAALQAAAFRFATFKTDHKPHRPLARIDISGAGKLTALDLTSATSAGNNLARWLTALPPNTLDAAGYRRLLREFARRLGLGFKFYGEAQLKRLGAGAFLAVSRGNAARDAGIVHLAYRPGVATPRVATPGVATPRVAARGSAAASRASRRTTSPPTVSLVGKGICFDTGGTNLKTHKSMLDMHIDMEGSAVAVGSLYALHSLRSPLSVDCWLAITENRTGPSAYKPQDVVTAHNGTTIQVIHTDAEGRMVLADTLSLAAAAKPRAIIDYATLTGACVYALTERYSGAFTNRPEARELLEAAGSSSGERVWCFPMDADFDTDLESTVADVLQCTTEGKGDHILAARFLNRFVPKQIAWLHLDLAAGSRTGGLAHIGTEITGFGVRYTLDLLQRGWPPAAQRAPPSGANGRATVRRTAAGAPAKRRLARAS